MNQYLRANQQESQQCLDSANKSAKEQLAAKDKVRWRAFLTSIILSFFLSLNDNLYCSDIPLLLAHSG